MELDQRNSDKKMNELIDPERYSDSSDKPDPIHSERHQMVKEMREYFREDAKKGVGSFSYYLGFFFKMPKPVIYRFFKEAKNIDDPIENQKRFFWWKIGKYLRSK